MKILHLCLASFYIDNYSYQENMLPKFHKKMGHEVEIIASLVSFDINGNSILTTKKEKYYNEFQIPVTRLDYKKNNEKLRRYKGTYNAIKNAKPDIIFIHGCQFLDIKYVAKYAKENPQVEIYVDNHADFSNSASNWLSKNILHKIIWKNCAKLIEPYTKKFYGVLPARVDFLHEIYKIKKEKIELLVMGADDEEIEKVQNSNTINHIREKYKVNANDFLIITGGKIDNAKRQTLLLMEAVKQLNNDNVKLLVFGSLVEELKEEFYSLVDNEKIIYIGWLKSEDSYKYLASSNLAVFPGRHSVLWEQAAGIGTPLIVKKWKGTDHIDIGGNCIFLYDDSVEEIKYKLDLILNDPVIYKDMLKSAQNGSAIFSYENIALRSIDYVKS